MADVTIRRLSSDEREAFTRSVLIPFLEPAAPSITDDPSEARFMRSIEADRAFVAVDGGRFVGNCCIYSLDVTVPAGAGGVCAILPMGGVSAVGVHPTHRRRGILTGLMGCMLSDIREKGEPIAGLIASESVIYGRYGFGLATESVTVSISSRRAQMVRPVADLDLQLIDLDEALKVLPPMWESLRRRRAGEPSMNDIRWEGVLSDDADRRQGASRLMVAVCDEGFVHYRARLGPGMVEGANTLVVQCLCGSSAAVEAALWRYLFDVDLTERVEAYRRPVDEPLRWWLADPRQLELNNVTDRLFVRIMDMPGAFGRRGYAAEGRLVLDVLPPSAGTDPGDPVPGRWVLEAGPDGATCAPAPPSESTDLRLDMTALGALYMGAFPASLLGATGWIEERQPGALARADRMLVTRPAPLTVSGF